MSSSSRTVACTQCQTQLPVEAKYCPACGRPAGSTSGTHRLKTTLHEGDRLAAGKTLLGGLAMYEALLGARGGERRGGSARMPVGDNVVDAVADISDRTTAPDGVDPGEPSIRAELVGEMPVQPEPAPAAPSLQEPFARPQVAAGRVSEGTMWRWARLRELIAEQGPGARARRSSAPDPVPTEAATGSLLGSRAVRIALLAAVIIVGASVVYVGLR